MSTTVAIPSSVRDALREGKRLLGGVSEEAALEAELLLMHTLSIGRARLYRSLNDQLSTSAVEGYQTLLNRRLDREPTPYILRHKEFFGLDFEVTHAAIIPRPETETLVGLAIDFAHRQFGDSRTDIVDVGTGSGVIAVSLAHALPRALLTAIDIAPEALDLARRNATRHGVASRTGFLQGDLLEPLEDTFDLIVANLPYVRTVDWERLPPEIRAHEPRDGLDGGPDGLGVIARLIQQARPRLKPGGALFIEIGDDQGPAANQLAVDVFPRGKIAIEPDLAGRDRVLAVLT